MNTANKITMSRIFLSVIILVLLLFPWHQVGIDMPVYIVNGNINMELKYIIPGVLFNAIFFPFNVNFTVELL